MIQRDFFLFFGTITSDEEEEEEENQTEIVTFGANKIFRWFSMVTLDHFHTRSITFLLPPQTPSVPAMKNLFFPQPQEYHNTHHRLVSSRD